MIATSIHDRCHAGTIVLLLAVPFGLAHAAPGDLDPAFGAGTGMVRDAMDIGGGQGQALVIDASGRIVVAGTAFGNGGDGDFGLLRLNTDGSPDAGFGLGGRSIHSASAGSDDEGYGLVLQADGKLVVAGASFDIGPANDFSALRLNDDGSIDNAFGNHGNGWMTTARPGTDVGLALAAASGGGFLLGGYVDGGSLIDAAGLRLDTLGMPDPLYGSSGFVIGAGDSNSFLAVAAQADGKAVFGGHIDSGGGAIVQRFNADGSVDAGFAGDGRAELAQLTRVEDIELLADGRILVAGHFLADARIVRLNADGTPDPAFGVGGTFTLTAASLGLNQLYLKSIALDGAGRVVVAGDAIGVGTGSQLLAVRMSPDGQLDAGFGTGGTRLLDAPGDLFGEAVAVQADGAIVIAGSDRNAGDDQYLVVRLQGGGGGPLPRTVSIGDASLVEGDAGSTLMTFGVNLSTPSDGSVSVDIATDLGSATPSIDYTPTTATMIFPNGTSAITFEVPVIGDPGVEPDETFLVRLANPLNATLGDAEATGTILDDDVALPPQGTVQAVPTLGTFALALLGLLMAASGGLLMRRHT